MGTQTTWEYFGLPPELDGRDVVAATASRNGQRAVTAAPRRRWRKRDRQPGERDRAAAWLRVAMAALGLLAATAAAVSFQAQYVLVREVKTTAGEVIAAMQAGDPGRGCAGVRGPGHCHGAVWPPGAAGPGGQRAVCRDLAGDERHSGRADAPGAGGVDHAGGAVCARQRHAHHGHPGARDRPAAGAAERLADDGEATPLAIVGGLCLWLLRLALAPWPAVQDARRNVRGPGCTRKALRSVTWRPAGRQLRTSASMGRPFCSSWTASAMPAAPGWRDRRAAGAGRPGRRAGPALRARGSGRRRPPRWRPQLGRPGPGRPVRGRRKR